MIHCRAAHPREAFQLSLREEDAREVSTGWRAAVAFDLWHHGGTAFHDDQGNLLGLAGVSMWEQEAAPWLLCSPRVDELPRAAVWRMAKAWVQALRASAGSRLIYNFIPKDSPRNRAFVEKLGFRILPSPRDGFDFFYLPHV